MKNSFGQGVFKGMHGGSAKGHAIPHASLNLTPMIDMMVIMLVFLIKSYSTSPEFLTPASGIKLADTTSEVSAPNSAVIIVSQEGILVEGKLIVKMKAGVPETGSVDKAGIMPALQTALTALATKTQAISKANVDVKFTGTLILQADKSVPFSNLKPILRTAGLAGFTDFKFAGVYPD